MTRAPSPNRRLRRAFYNWDGREPAWRPNPTTDLRELIAFAKFPFASLAPRNTPLRYQFWQREKPHFVDARPIDPDIGLATIADLDIMIVVTSYLAWHHNHPGAPYRGVLTLKPATILHTLDKSTGGAQHRDLHAALARLANTEITTSVGNYGDARFALLEDVQAPNEKGELRLKIDPWLWAQVEAERMVKIDPVAFTLRGLERRLYSWARVYLGATGQAWRISTPRAHAALGAQEALRKFRSRLAQIAARQRLPHFFVTLEHAGQDTTLVLTPRDPRAPTAATHTQTLILQFDGDAARFVEEAPTGGEIVFKLDALFGDD